MSTEEENVKLVKQKHPCLCPCLCSHFEHVSVCEWLQWEDAWSRRRHKMMTDMVTSHRSQRIKYKTGSPIQPGGNFASFCPLNGPTPPASRAFITSITPHNQKCWLRCPSNQTNQTSRPCLSGAGPLSSGNSLACSCLAGWPRPSQAFREQP